MNNNYINEIINRRYNTDKGYLYLIDLLKEKYPDFNINEENLNKLSIEEVSKEMFLETSFVGVYTAKDNKIRIFTNYDIDGNEIIPGIEITEEELINTFLHELIHCVSSKVDGEMIYEGFNMRVDGQSSYFLGINEGITQMVTDDILGYKSDAYVFQTIIARQLGEIVGKDNLVKAYSNNDIMMFEDLVMSKDCNFNFKDFIINNFYFNLIVNGHLFNNAEMIGTNIQEQLLLLGKDKINDLVLNSNRINELVHLLPIDVFSFSDIGFDDIDNVVNKYMDDDYTR